MTQVYNSHGEFTLDDILATDTNKHFEAVEKTKLGGIETGATADQTASEIKTAYESNANTNAFTDSEKTKLSGIETGADVTDATNVDAAGAVMNSDTSTANMNFVVDEDDMSSNSENKIPTQQSVKAYVDNEISSSSLSAHYSGTLLGGSNAVLSAVPSWATHFLVHLHFSSYNDATYIMPIRSGVSTMTTLPSDTIPGDSRNLFGAVMQYNTSTRVFTLSHIGWKKMSVSSGNWVSRNSNSAYYLDAIYLV